MCVCVFLCVYDFAVYSFRFFVFAGKILSLSKVRYSPFAPRTMADHVPPTMPVQLVILQKLDSNIPASRLNESQLKNVLQTDSSEVCSQISDIPFSKTGEYSTFYFEII